MAVGGGGWIAGQGYGQETYSMHTDVDTVTHKILCTGGLRGHFTDHDSYISFPPQEVFISLVCYLWFDISRSFFLLLSCFKLLKILISVLMIWQRAIEIQIETQRERQKWPERCAPVCVNYWNCHQFLSGPIWQTTKWTLCMFVPWEVCVSVCMCVCRSVMR